MRFETVKVEDIPPAGTRGQKYDSLAAVVRREHPQAVVVAFSELGIKPGQGHSVRLALSARAEGNESFFVVERGNRLYVWMEH